MSTRGETKIAKAPAPAPAPPPLAAAPASAAPAAPSQPAAPPRTLLVALADGCSVEDVAGLAAAIGRLSGVVRVSGRPDADERWAARQAAADRAEIALRNVVRGCAFAFEEGVADLRRGLLGGLDAAVKGVCKELSG